MPKPHKGAKQDVGQGLASSSVGGEVLMQPMAIDIEMRRFNFGELDPMTEEWVLRCAIKKLRANVDVSTLQFRIELTGIKARVPRVEMLFVQLSFRGRNLGIFFLKQNAELLESWLEGLVGWEVSDLALANRRWVGVPMFLWHSEIFDRVRLEFGALVKVDHRTVDWCRYI